MNDVIEVTKEELDPWRACDDCGLVGKHFATNPATGKTHLVEKDGTWHVCPAKQKGHL